MQTPTFKNQVYADTVIYYIAEEYDEPLPA
jgi:hypothetical protein